MQEEVEAKAVNLVISTSKLTARTIISAVQAYLRNRKETKVQQPAEEDSKISGKQTVKELLSQGQGATSIDIAKTDLRGFEQMARKYGIDYAIRKETDAGIPKYLVFFKARDADAMTAAFNEYSQKALQKSSRPSVLQELRKLAALVAAVPGKVINRDKQREQSR